jgi:hypothetical protein
LPSIQCQIKVAIFEAIVHDLRAVLRLAQGRNQQLLVAELDQNS